VEDRHGGKHRLAMTGDKFLGSLFLLSSSQHVFTKENLPNSDLMIADRLYEFFIWYQV
jgi:hypothetical protein